jgi:hypothetical protein
MFVSPAVVVTALLGVLVYHDIKATKNNHEEKILTRTLIWGLISATCVAYLISDIVGGQIVIPRIVLLVINACTCGFLSFQKGKILIKTISKN